MKFRDKHLKNLNSDKDAFDSLLVTSDVQQKVEVESPDCLASELSLSNAPEKAKADIDWEIATIEQSSQPQQESAELTTEENGRKKDESMGSLQEGIDWNSNDIRETGEVEIQWDIGNSDAIFCGDSMESEIRWDTVNTDTAFSEESCIDWDISIEDGAGLETDVQALPLETQSSIVAQERVVIENELMDTEFRNNLLDDLLEVIRLS